MKNPEKLVEAHKRLIESEARKYSAVVPQTVVTAEAYKLAYEAAKSYDEKSGVQFSTYLVNYLKKLNRLSTRYGGAVRISENKQYKINRLLAIQKHLKAELGREPSVSEISDASGYPVQTVQGLLNDAKQEVVMSNLVSSPVFVNNDTELDDWIYFVYHDLPERDKLIFEHSTGFGGKKILTKEEIAKKLGISVSTVNQRLRLITQKIQEKQSQRIRGPYGIKLQRFI